MTPLEDDTVTFHLQPLLDSMEGRLTKHIERIAECQDQVHKDFQDVHSRVTILEHDNIWIVRFIIFLSAGFVAAAYDHVRGWIAAIWKF
jgi:hypothetical protein